MGSEVDPGNRAWWSAGAGAPVLATAIVQLGWLVRTLTELSGITDGPDNVGVRWSRSRNQRAGLFFGKPCGHGPAKKGREPNELQALPTQKRRLKAFYALHFAVRKLMPKERRLQTCFINWSSLMAKTTSEAPHEV